MNRLYLALFMLALCSCGGGSDRDDREEGSLVYKSQEEIQCEFDGIPLAEMELELTSAGIDVLCNQEGTTGFSYPDVCGAGTSSINVYRIHDANIPDAENLGFSLLVATDEVPDIQALGECE